MATWPSSNCLVHNQFDFIQLPRSLSINKARTRMYSGIDVGKDYDLISLVKVEWEAPLSLATRFTLIWRKCKTLPNVREIFNPQAKSKFAAQYD